MSLLMHIFTYIHSITFNIMCRNLVTTSYNIRSPRNHDPYSALSRLFCAWQTLFISHQRWVNLLSTSREIAWTRPWNQHSHHGSSWNILNFKIHGWSWWADSPFGFPSILWTYSTSPITFSDPLTFNPSVAPCCLCSTRALLGLNRLKARHWVWPRWRLWELTPSWRWHEPKGFSLYQFSCGRTWLLIGHDCATVTTSVFSIVFHCRNVFASYQCTAGSTL